MHRTPSPLGLAHGKYVLCLALIGLAVLIRFHPMSPSHERFFEWQAKGFLAGRLDVAREDAKKSNFIDHVVRDGRVYMPLGPLPSVLLMPLVALAPGRPVAAWAHAALGIVAAVLSFFVARRWGFDRHQAAWAAAAFTFTSSAVGVIFIDGPWYMAHVIVLILFMLALLEHKGKDRPAVIGTFLALAVASRVTAAAGVLYFVVLAVREGATKKDLAKRLGLMLLPMAVVVLCLAWFNAARFGSPFNNGYSSQVDVYGTRTSVEKPIYGLFNPHYIPYNARYYFLQGPVMRDGRFMADTGGLSLLFIGPIFLLVLLGDPKDREWLAGMLVTAVVLSLFLCFFATGASQFGVRYVNDALPFLYVALLVTLRRIGFGPRKRWIVLGGALTNLALIVSTYR